LVYFIFSARFISVVYFWQAGSLSLYGLLASSGPLMLFGLLVVDGSLVFSGLLAVPGSLAHFGFLVRAGSLLSFTTPNNTNKHTHTKTDCNIFFKKSFTARMSSSHTRNSDKPAACISCRPSPVGSASRTNACTRI
jgi:hypothetical protein